MQILLLFTFLLSDDTKNLISKKELSLMKKNTIIVNTARGGIVNQDDLFNPWLKENFRCWFGCLYSRTSRKE